MSAHKDFAANNQKYVETFKSGDLPIPPSKKLLVVTCMDARIDAFSSLGLNLGEAHVVRNAGGRVQDAIRSIIISQRLLGTREIAVFHHTGCGMLTFSTPQLREIVKKDAAPEHATDIAQVVDQTNFLEFTDLEQSVKDDVEFLKGNSLLLKDTTVTGWIYDVHDGKVKQVA
ncbi:carbonic anhydrase [Dendrothele bispora CBS 962.96]|uniref:Carbonic anhydrase n=1 Tax=Dendrothele bispora (strain CBS 962.96) TaxID=1314807 RepID=A0A4S8MQ49_DENBC|nr:carbonic anhydrase [Dendrothele bispora CBS 962.96]